MAGYGLRVLCWLVGAWVALNGGAGAQGAGTNWALATNGATASASSQYNTTTYSAAKAIDGNRLGTNNTNYWNDNTFDGFPDWLQVTFSGVKTIGEIDVVTLQDELTSPVPPTEAMTFSLANHNQPTAFLVQYLDGGSWVTIPGGGVTGNNKVWRKFTFSPVTTTAIRVYVTAANGHYTVITELEAYEYEATAPSAPTNLTATAALGPLINLTWTDTSTNEAGFKLERKTGAGGTYAEIATPAANATSYTDAAVSPGITYYYRIRATNAFGDSAYSNEAQATAPATNVALAANGATASASSQYDTTTYSAAKAIDGNRLGTNNINYWNDNTFDGFPDWLQVTFSGVKTINEIDVVTLQDELISPVPPTEAMTFTLANHNQPTAFLVQYLDGSTWTTIPGGNVTGNNKVWRKFTFSPITTTAIRVYVTAANGRYTVITELEAYEAPSTGPQAYFIHTDHLNTPRAITNQAGQAVWRWDNADPFGNNAPDENPSGLGTFTCNLRFPGQYFDKETNLHYNYQRWFDPAIGRYIQSDPIGLEGGINTYAYANSNPLSFTDPDGLDATITFYPGGVRHIGIGINSPNTVGLYPRTQSVSVAICRDVPGAILSDPTFQAGSIAGSRSITIKTTAEQDARMQQFINLRQQGGVEPTYNLCSNQCSSFVGQVLQAGSVVLPESPSPLPLNFFNQLRGMYGQGRR